MYNVSQDVEDPEQTFHFNCDNGKDTESFQNFQASAQRHAASPRSPFGKRPFDRSIDSAMMEAVSMSFGRGEGWGSMTIYGLMRNGDVYCLCPILPYHRYVTR
jgi:hypothetical protein